MGDFNILEYATILPMEERRLHFPIMGYPLRLGMMVANSVDVQSHFLTGDGIDTPLGILSGAVISGEPVAHTVRRNEVGTICADDLVTMHLLHAWRGHWLLNPFAYNLVAKLRDATGVYFLDAERELLLGRPISKHEPSPKLGEVGDVLLADFGSYIIGRYEHSGEVWYDGMPVSSVIQTSSGPMYRFVALGEALEWQPQPKITFWKRILSFFRRTA